MSSFRVGPGRVPVHTDASGKIVSVGRRKFTYEELIRYKRNMYGQRYFQRLGIKSQKKFTHEEISERARQSWQTKRELYGKDAGHKIVQKTIATRKKNPHYREYIKTITDNLHRPEVVAKITATWRAKEHTTTDAHRLRHRYFICDCEIDGQEFHEGEWLDMDDPLFEKAREMMLVDPKDYLTPETRHLAMLNRSRLNNCRGRCKQWFARRPDVIRALVKA